MVTAVICATPRNACRAAMTDWICSGAFAMASSICLLQAGDTLADMMDFMDIVHERRFERRLLKVYLVVQPGHVLRRPLLFDVRGRLPSVPQQKFAQPLTRSLPVRFGIFSRSYQIAQCLMRRIGNP